MYNSQTGMVLDFRARVKITESCPKALYNLWCHLHNIWSWNRAHCPYVCSRYIKKGPLYFTHAT